MQIQFSETAWSQLNEWLTTDRKTFARIQALIADTTREPFSGIGKPELLKHNLSGYWSRRIDSENRLIYRVNNDVLEIIACRGHYK